MFGHPIQCLVEQTRIIEFLGFRETARVMCVSRILRKLAGAVRLWTRMFYSYFGSDATKRMLSEILEGKAFLQNHKNIFVTTTPTKISVFFNVVMQGETPFLVLISAKQWFLFCGE